MKDKKECSKKPSDDCCIGGIKSIRIVSYEDLDGVVSGRWETYPVNNVRDETIHKDKDGKYWIPTTVTWKIKM